jgi:hypothetical protein
MREVGVAWLLWMLVLGGSGCALGFLAVLTMPAPAVSRVAAAGLVFAACVLAIGLSVVGLMPALFGLLGVFLMPVLAALGLRRRWSGAKGQQGLERD